MVTSVVENAQAVGSIHETAIVDERATINPNVMIGPYSIVGPNVVLGEDCRLESHVVIGGNTTLGPRNHIFSFASIGLQPQDLKYRGEKSRLDIGAENVIREHVTMNPGTEAPNPCLRNELLEHLFNHFPVLGFQMQFAHAFSSASSNAFASLRNDFAEPATFSAVASS